MASLIFFIRHGLDYLDDIALFLSGVASARVSENLNLVGDSIKTDFVLTKFLTGM